MDVLAGKVFFRYAQVIAAHKGPAGEPNAAGLMAIASSLIPSDKSIREAAAEAAAEADTAPAAEPAGHETPDEWEKEQVQAAQRAEGSKKHRPFKAPTL